MIKNRGERWTTEEINLTKNLYLKGVGISDIVSQVKHSESAIQKKIKELGFTNRKVLWTDSDIKYLKELFSKGLSYSEISKKLNKSVRACQAKAIRLGLKTKECNAWINNSRADFWTDEEIKKLLYCADNYTSYSEISNIMGRSVKAITFKLHELHKHIKEKSIIEKSEYRRAYSVDDNYFENIDTQKKAYWLGWLVTDGYVCSKVNSSRGSYNTNYVSLKLQDKDLNVLEDFKKDINTSVSIREVKRNKPIEYTNKITNKTVVINSGDQAELRFSSAKMIQDLAKYGIHQNKTYDIGFPKALDSKFYSGFIAGVISGDGCVDVRKNHKGYILRCTIAGNYDLVSNIHLILSKEINMNPDKKIMKYKGSAQLYRLELNQTETINLYKWFNQNGVKLMERKNKMIEDYLAEKAFKAA